MKTRLYAELRQSIRCISLSVEVEDWSKLASMEVVEDGTVVQVRFNDGALQRMTLPGKGQRGVLPIPKAPNSGLQFRIQLEGGGGFTDLPPTAVEIKAPWCVEDLQSDAKSVSVHCRNCQSCIVAAGSIDECRALPSSGWAEMMDLWHCHKPTEEGDISGEGTLKKKYGSGFIEKSGVGLVGLTDLMIHESNCNDIEVKEKSGRKLIYCGSCGFALGEIIKNNPGLRSFTKWSLAINSNESGIRTSEPVSFPVSAFVGTRLLSLIEEQAVWHFFLPSPVGFEHLCGLRIWIFHPDVAVSMSPAPPAIDKTPFRAMKVFYIADSELEAQDDFKEDTMQLPVSAWKAFRDDLIASTKMLPTNERKWKVWSIGLIQRF